MAMQEIQSILSQSIEQNFGQKIEPEVSYPDVKFGDFATNVAFHLAKPLKTSPVEIAEKLAASINHGHIESATAINGFINIRMTRGYWVEKLHEIDGKFGSKEIGAGKKLQVEFISANPTGPLTLGNARGGYVGDVIGRVMQHQGFSVTNEYYFNDAGTQIRILVGSVKAAAGMIEKREDHYPGDYIEELAKDFRSDLESKDDNELAKILTQAIFERWIKPSIDKMGINYDEWFNESSLVESGEFNHVLELLEEKGMSYEKDGALWLASSKYGDERDRVIKKSNGDVTYLGTDIAYHLNIFNKRGFDHAVKIWGADHAGQVPSLKLTLDQLAPEKQLDFVLMQWVRLIKNGQEVKMSKRAGTYVTVEELVDEVGSDVARFFFLQRSTDTAMDFDLDLAKEQSQKNPLYYVMYSYARAHSILKQASIRGLAPVSSVEEISDQELALIRFISRFPNTLEEVVQDYGVHRLTFFAIETAKLFHDLYESERIIDLDKGIASKRLYTIQKYTQFLRLLFGLIGITPTDRMEHTEEPNTSKTA